MSNLLGATRREWFVGGYIETNQGTGRGKIVFDSGMSWPFNDRSEVLATKNGWAVQYEGKTWELDEYGITTGLFEPKELHVNVTGVGLHNGCGGQPAHVRLSPSVVGTTPGCGAPPALLDVVKAHGGTMIGGDECGTYAVPSGHTGACHICGGPPGKPFCSACPPDRDVPVLRFWGCTADYANEAERCADRRVVESISEDETPPIGGIVDVTHA